MERELAILNLSLRYDSRLCSSYISNHISPEWTAAKVAKECAVMHWLHNYTNYKEICHNAATQESQRLRFWRGREFADHMKRRIYPAIKDDIIRGNGGLPESWPWMEKIHPRESPT